MQFEILFEKFTFIFLRLFKALLKTRRWELVDFKSASVDEKSACIHVILSLHQYQVKNFYPMICGVKTLRLRDVLYQKVQNLWSTY